MTGDFGKRNTPHVAKAGPHTRFMRDRNSRYNQTRLDYRKRIKLVHISWMRSRSILKLRERDMLTIITVISQRFDFNRFRAIHCS